MAAIFVWTTAPDMKSARTLAELLVRKKLAACVTIQKGAVSFYKWKGKMERAAEVTLVIKTVSSKFSRLQARIEREHPYELPEVVALPIVKGSKKYLAWLKKGVKV